MLLGGAAEYGGMEISLLQNCYGGGKVIRLMLGNSS